MVISLSEVVVLCRSSGIPTRSLRVALVVGSILNLINQGDALISSASFNWWKIVLTYIVPYCVATYGAVSFRLATLRGSERRANTPPTA